MATFADLDQHMDARPHGPIEWIRHFFLNIAWALEVRHRCQQASTASKPLNHDTLNRIVAEVDAVVLAKRAQPR